MTLNPSAEVFVPSSNTLRMLGNTKLHKDETLLSSMNYNYPPPQLESIYLDTGHLLAAQEDEEAEEQGLTQLSETARKDIDYTNFDVNFFFLDLTSADSDDFENYLSDRAEYLLGYAGTSQTHADEVVENILGLNYNLLRKKGRNYKRPLILAAKMCEMDQVFLEMMLYKLSQLLQFIRNDMNWKSADFAYHVLLGLMLGELHIGTCIAPPVTPNGFINDLCQVLSDLLRDRRTLGTALAALEECVEQVRSMASIEQIGLLHCMLRKHMHPSSNSAEVMNRLQRIFMALQKKTPFYCANLHVIPVAQMNDEESQAFEVFLREKQASDFRRRD